MNSFTPVEYTSRPAPEDELFLERLDSFMQKNLADIRAFSERELRPFEETRRTVAEWHAKHLFQATGSAATEPFNRKEYARSVMIETSRILEDLAATSAIQSFFLAIDPCDDQNPGFLGGSNQGRTFWRNLRGGGDQGAKAFKQQCTRASAPLRPSSSTMSVDSQESSGQTASSSSNKQDAKTVKADLYELVRKILRMASGHNSAEMKWSNHERLDIYGVRLVGWPDGIPTQNPSALKLSQNKELLEGFRSGTIKFERHPLPDCSEAENPPEEDDLSWALETDPISLRTTSPVYVQDPGSRVPSSSATSLLPHSEPLARETTPVDTNLHRNPSALDSTAVDPSGSNGTTWLEDQRNRKRRRSEEGDGSCPQDVQ